MWQKIKNYYHLVQAVIANSIYGFPGRKAIIIGVTGTDGKTTTVSLIYHILKSAGKKVSMITSVGAYIGDQVYDIGFHVTTPSPFGLQKYLRRAVDWGADYIVLETTSHAIDQNRIWGIDYKIGVLTNITHEHLDYHKTYGDYAGTKFKLLERSEIAVVNIDDKSWSILVPLIKSKPRLENKARLYTYSLNNPVANFTIKKFPFETKLLGDFNKLNCLASVAVCKALDVSDADIRKGLAPFKAPPGRVETVYDDDFRVIIDFAHTPNAFAAILPEIRKITKGRIIHVFGSAGMRDKSKRPEMGRESSRYADIIILTAEDPRDEKAERINKMIIEGIGNNYYSVGKSGMGAKGEKKLIFEIPDRKEAIRYAVKIADEGDTVLLTGKAHEKSMNYGHGEEPWDEFAETRAALKTRHLI